MTDNKVLLLIESGGPGGAERLVLSLARSYRDRGLQVVVLTFREGWLTQELDEQAFERLNIKSEKGFDLQLPFKIAALIKQHGIKVLHSHLLDSNFYGGLAARIAGVPHVATEHGDIHHTKRKKFLRLKLGILARLCTTRFVAVSSFSARVLRELGVPAGRIQVIHNPAVFPESADPITREEARTLLGISEPGHFLWLHVGMLRAVKNQKLLLEAFAQTLTGIPAQTMCLVGDGPERAALEQHAAELGLQERVKFLGFQRDTSRWFRAADACVMSSLSESLPMALLEAAAAGLPLVSTDVGGVSEIIHPPENGFLVPTNDSRALAGAMSKLAGDQALAKRMGLKSRVLADTQFSLSNATSEYLQLFEILLW